MFSGDSIEIKVMQQLEWLFFNEILHIQKRKPGLTQNQLRICAAEHHPMHSFILQAARRTDKQGGAGLSALEHKDRNKAGTRGGPD